LKAIGAAMTKRAIAAVAKALRALGKATTSVKRAGTVVQKAATSFRKLGKQAAVASVGLDKVAASGRKIAGGVNTASAAAKTAAGSFGAFRSKLFDALLVTALVTGFVRGISRAVGAVASLFTAARDASIELTGINITLKAATGSTEEFVTASLAASEIARRYGVELLTVSRGLADFLAATQTSTLAFEEQIAIFESLVRAGRVLNLSNERIRLSILAIGQIASKGCVDVDTEILTPSGWLRWADLGEHEEVAGLDLESGKVVWQEMNGLAKFHFDGEATIAYRGESEVAMIPNHRVVVGAGGGALKVEEAALLRSGDLWPVFPSLGEPLLGDAYRLEAVQIRRARWAGDVWCPRTPTSTWIARKSGFVFATGNSLQMEELKRQLESIPGAVPRLAKALGITVPQLFERTSQGAIGAAEALRGLRIVFNEIAAEQIVVSMQSLAAVLGRVKIEADLVKIAFGDAADEGLRKVAEAGQQLAKDLQPLASELGSLATDSLLPVSAALLRVSADLAAVIGVGVRFGDFSNFVQGGLGTISAAANELGVNTTLAQAALELFLRDLKKTGEEARLVQLFKLSEEFRELEQAILDGSVALTSAFQDSAKGRQEAAAQIAKINAAFKAGLIGEVEALRLKKSVVLEIAEAEQVEFELLKIRDQERQAAIQRSIDKKIEEAQVAEGLAEVEKALAKERLQAIGEAVQAAEELAGKRIAESARTRAEITDSERQLLDERLAIFEKALAGVELSGGKRLEIERALSEELLDLEQKFQEKRQKLIDDANEAIKEDGSKRKEILEKLTEDLAKLLEKQGQDVDKLIKKRVDGAKKAADREIKEAERSAKKQRELLQSIGDALDSLEQKRLAALGGDDEAGDIAGPSVGAVDASALRAELDELNRKALESGLTFEEFQRQAELLAQSMDLAGGAVQSFGDDLVGVSQTRLASFNESAAEATRLIASFGDDPRAQQNIRDLSSELEDMAAQGNLTAEELANAFFSLQENIETAKRQTEDSGLPKLGEDAAAAAGGVSQIAEQLQAAGAAVEVVRDGVEGARINITNLGEEAEAAGGGVQVLTDKEAEAAEAADRLAESVGEAAAKEQELADAAQAAAENVTIPQEALDSITRLQEVLGELELDPLLVPLETLASTTKSLSESVPLLPEPLREVVASLLELVEGEILGPLAEGFEKVNAQVEPLAEKLPIVAEAQADFNKAAEESKEPLESLEARLKKISEEELLGRLEKLAEDLAAIADAAVKLGEASEAADGLAQAVAELLRELTSFAEFLSGTFADALSQHAEDWQKPLDAANEYREELEDQIANVFPEWSTAASSMFDEPDARAEGFRNTLQEISRLLDEVIVKSEALG